MDDGQTVPAAGAAPFKKRRHHPDVVVPDPTKPMHGFDADAAGFSYEDMCTAVSVLAAVGKNLELFDSRALKPLRVAVMPLGEYQANKLYRGASKEEYMLRKDIVISSNSRRMRVQRLDKQYINKTQLRASRIAKLKDLTADGAISVPLIPDGVVDDSHVAVPPPMLTDAAVAPPEDAASVRPPPPAAQALFGLRSCYACKVRFDQLHHFYDQLCPPCAALNFTKRHQTANLAGYVAVVTGGRVKIGYRCVLKLLRCGAHVVATTRFPQESSGRFTVERDYDEWKHRLDIVGLDLRSTVAIEEFCEFIRARFSRVDILVNNACQTVRRPPSFYAHLLEREATPIAMLDDKAAALLRADQEFRSHLASITPTSAGPDALRLTDADASMPAASAAASQLRFVAGDEEHDTALFPVGLKDVNDQQVDLRTTNSWTMKLGEVSTPEIAEVFAINALAPFVLNSKLKPMMVSPFVLDGESCSRHAFVVNVSAMEGKFYRYKTPMHPHTNMAKAALNMMTRTSAPDFATSGIFMTSVDTGWINDENPLEKASRVASTNNFQTPLDEEDAAARVLDPIIASVNEVASNPAFIPVHGVFLKDYRETEW